MTDDDTRAWRRAVEQVADGTVIAAGDKVAITITGPEAYQVAQSMAELVYQRGGLPQVVVVDERSERAAVATAPDDVLATPSPLEMAAIAWADVYIAFRAMTPPETQQHDDAARRRALLREAKGRVSTARWRGTRWAIVRIPTTAWADFAGLDRHVLMEEFFAGTLLDWSARRQDWRALADDLRQARRVRITDDDTDLTMTVAGRTWVPFAGESNFPDGELATAPLDDSAQGHITFPGSFVFADTVIRNLRLDFTDGEVSAVAADRGLRVAEQLLATDSGSRRIGELGIGLNAAMSTVTGDLFFDEKILGTVHIALGRAYPECGGTNTSALHWDIVKDLRPGPGRAGGDLVCDGVALITAGSPTSALLAPTSTPETHDD